MNWWISAWPTPGLLCDYRLSVNRVAGDCGRLGRGVCSFFGSSLVIEAANSTDRGRLSVLMYIFGAFWPYLRIFVFFVNLWNDWDDKSLEMFVKVVVFCRQSFGEYFQFRKRMSLVKSNCSQTRRQSAPMRAWTLAEQAAETGIECTRTQ